MYRSIFFFGLLALPLDPAKAAVPPPTTSASADTTIPRVPRRLPFCSRRGAVDAQAEEQELLLRPVVALEKEIQLVRRLLEATSMGRVAIGHIDQLGKERPFGPWRAGVIHQSSYNRVGEQHLKDWSVSSAARKRSKRHAIVPDYIAQKIREDVHRAFFSRGRDLHSAHILIND